MARVAVSWDPTDDAKLGVKESHGLADYDPYAIQKQFELIQSDAVLGRVARKLNLAEIWGRSHGRGQNLHEADAIKLLKKGLELRPARNTSLLEIRFSSGDSQEAANIANELAVTSRTFNEEQLAGKPKSTAGTPNSAPIVIIDRAETNSFPVRPKKVLILVLGIIGGILLAALGGGAGVLFAHFSRRASKLGGG